MVKLGLMYHDGVGGEKDKTAARSWFEKTLEAGDTEAAGQAMWALGTMCKRHEAGMSPRDAEDFYARRRPLGIAGRIDARKKPGQCARPSPNRHYRLHSVQGQACGNI